MLPLLQIEFTLFIFRFLLLLSWTELPSEIASTLLDSNFLKYHLLVTLSMMPTNFFLSFDGFTNYTIYKIKHLCSNKNKNQKNALKFTYLPLSLLGRLQRNWKFSLFFSVTPQFQSRIRSCMKTSLNICGYSSPTRLFDNIKSIYFQIIMYFQILLTFYLCSATFFSCSFINVGLL